MTTLEAFGPTIEDIQKSAKEEVEKNRKKSGIYLLNEYLELEATKGTNWLVKNLIGDQELVLLTGAAKLGKSMFASNVALAVSQRLSFLGEEPCESRRVLIVQTEVAEGAYAERLRKMLTVGEIAVSDNLLITGTRYRLDKPDVEHGVNELKQIIETYRPQLLVLDPFYTMHAGDENDASHIGQTLTHLKKMIQETKIACLLIHHQGKGGEASSSKSAGHRARGSSAFADVPDTSLSLVRNGEKVELMFEARNMAPRENVRLALNKDSMWWEIENQPKDQKAKSVSIEELLKVVEETPGINRAQLDAKLKTLYSIGTTTIGKRINEALEAGLLRKVEDPTDRSKVQFFVVAQSNKQHQHSLSLGNGDGDVVGSEDFFL